MKYNAARLIQQKFKEKLEDDLKKSPNVSKSRRKIKKAVKKNYML
jgi:hypothetical protein